ncbi:MAG TPA: hypothetical protein VGY57_05290 [Vicinamibacterales bacterium]|nr:hypothetical protein [Vicinamibacterales bacterium]
MTFLLVVTFVSMLLALVMSLAAWRVARDERERSDARVAALAEDIHSVAPAAAQAGGRRGEPARLKAVAPPIAQSADLFSAAQPTSSSSRSAIVVGVGLLIFATAAALIVVLGGNARNASTAAGRPAGAAARANTSPAATAASTAASGTPLELVALGHDRDGDRLTVRGVIRNPMSGARVDRLTAVVFMFDRDGGFLGSGRGSIDAASLSPGGDSTFAVAVLGASNVARYRVSFRTETGIVAHVDKRTRP